MIHVAFDPLALEGARHTEWDAWHTRARAATHDIIEAWEKNRTIRSRDFDDNIWGELKKWLLEHVFHGKCAYCETHIGMARQAGDAEHFRPKGGVNYKDLPPNDTAYTTAITRDENDQALHHPGYFWLAYDWKNLLPACQGCNSHQGKKNQFPTQNSVYILVQRLTQTEVAQLQAPPTPSRQWPDVYYLDPDDLNALETPHLLHPYVDRPEEHLGFDEHGQVYAKEVNGQLSLQGRHSIAVYDLRNEGLRQARQRTQEQAGMLFQMAVNYFMFLHGDTVNTARQRAWDEPKIATIVRGETPYAAAARDFLRRQFA